MENKELIEILEKLELVKTEDINKYKAIELVKLFPQISESALGAVFNAVPNFLNLLEEGLKAEKEIAEKTLEYNAKSTESLNIQFDLVLETLRSAQNKENITFEERKYYINKMVEVLELASQNDTKNKVFMEKTTKAISDRNDKNNNLAVGFLAGITGIGLIALGFMSDNTYLMEQGSKKLAKTAVDLADKKGLIK